jgi:hypothetical protein
MVNGNTMITRSIWWGLPWLTAWGLFGATAYAADESPPSPTQAPPQTIAAGRLDLRPFGGWSAWPQSRTAALAGVDAGLRFDALAAVELDVAAYQPFNTSEGPGGASGRLNEAQGSASVDLVFFPLSKGPRLGSAAKGAELGSFEPYVLFPGVGVVRTRPVAVVDPVNRKFDDWNNLIDLSAAIGGRLFINHWLAVDLELRDLMYFEKMEATTVAMGSGNPASPASPLNPATWYDPNTHFTNAAQVRLGASFFVPP